MTELVKNNDHALKYANDELKMDETLSKLKAKQWALLQEKIAENFTDVFPKIHDLLSEIFERHGSFTWKFKKKLKYKSKLLWFESVITDTNVLKGVFDMQPGPSLRASAALKLWGIQATKKNT